MAFSIKILYDLQQVDWSILKASEQLSENRAALADDSAVREAAEKTDSLRIDLRQAKVAQRSSELELRGLESKISEISARMYGGQVTSERQYQAMTEERSFLEAQQGEEEDRLLETMVRIDDLESDLAGSELSLEDLTQARSVLTETLSADNEDLESEFAELGIRRRELVAVVPAHVLATYEALLVRREGRAVALVERGICEGCRLTLPTGELSRARSEEGVHQCSSCSRILFVP